MDTNRAPEAEPAPGAEPLGTDLIIPAIGCSLAVYYMVSTTDLAWESKATGIVIGICLLAMCAAHFARLALRLVSGRGRFSFGDLFDMTPINRQRFALFGLTAVFIATMDWVGTTLGLFLLLMASMWVTGVRNLRQLVVISFAVSATVYILLIWLLSSRLPRGPLEQLLGSLLGGAG